MRWHLLIYAPTVVCIPVLRLPSSTCRKSRYIHSPSFKALYHDVSCLSLVFGRSNIPSLVHQSSQSNSFSLILCHLYLLSHVAGHVAASRLSMVESSDISEDVVMLQTVLRFLCACQRSVGHLPPDIGERSQV
ncbi:hypothetical protein BV25DRAFT_1042138 [Artomyces pyxidatus]|uniref:Uncharacterized protein n=1 Tax=Artomyces pyxidatus TaxID=48021 RepID=A0ACB8SUP8_9AGAM|nr:hypothetical protein BV25DRAFT_1042138 [Artomyces pyxidatus]